METDPDLTSVTARATEFAGATGGSVNGPWKVTAIVACAAPLYFPGLELRRNTEIGGGFLESEREVSLAVNCSAKNQKIIAAASRIDDYDLGQWLFEPLQPVQRPLSQPPQC